MAELASTRKLAYKHVSIADSHLSQQARRLKALEEQKKRRAQRVDASRQLDSFADLNLGSDDDDDGRPPQIVREGLGAFVGRIPPESASVPPYQPIPSTFQPSRKSKKKRKWQRIKKPADDEINEWADKCMYAELLEMNTDDPWSSSDGLPDDLETGWVAVAPVPVGKRCLAIVHQGLGLAPNTTLRSRALGKPLMARFPSTIPPNTVLDCILDINWRDNGILHVLDVIKWKGQDICDCETAFRFWWRDTRLAELPQSPPPTTSSTKGLIASGIDPSSSSQYRFSYPTLMLPIPYHSDTSLPSLLSGIVPLARSSRSIPFGIPVIDGGMDLDMAGSNITKQFAHISPDGLLLYVAEANYEFGTSPLSNWIPINSHVDSETMDSASETPLDKFQRLVQRRLSQRLQTTSEDDRMDL
ncbi:hypothetical protein CPB85DRAFT_1373579 [Mucidula mucida]|nr:hypothetical protein CPB85DRAFT_1373579 [Mucidula mucida]